MRLCLQRYISGQKKYLLIGHIMLSLEPTKLTARPCNPSDPTLGVLWIPWSPASAYRTQAPLPFCSLFSFCLRCFSSSCCLPLILSCFKWEVTLRISHWFSNQSWFVLIIFHKLYFFYFSWLILMTMCNYIIMYAIIC